MTKQSVSQSRVVEKIREIEVACNVLTEYAHALSDHAQHCALLLHKHDPNVCSDTVEKVAGLQASIVVLQQILGRGSTADQLHATIAALGIGVTGTEAPEYMVGYDEGYEDGFDEGFDAADGVSYDEGYDKGHDTGFELGYDYGQIAAGSEGPH